MKKMIILFVSFVNENWYSQMATQKNHKLNIFSVLSKISTKNKTFYGELSDDERKALHPLVVMRWLSGTSSERQIVFLNEFVNQYVFNLANHKELLVDLMEVCTSGNSPRYKWMKAKSKKTTSTPNVTNVIRDYYGYNTIDAVEVLPLLSDDKIISFAEILGRQPDVLRLIKKELRARTKK